ASHIRPSSTGKAAETSPQDLHTSRGPSPPGVLRVVVMELGGRRVLVVEDDSTIAASIAARLRAEGFGVDVVHDGPAAVEAEAAAEPDLVVLDLMLPGFDGLEVCRRIQGRRPVPVLMLTARADETDMLVGLGVGADD